MDTDTTTVDDPIRDADTAINLLKSWEQHPAADVLCAAYAVPIHLHRALSGQWWALSPLDQADVYTLRITGESLGQYGTAVLAHAGAARLAPIIAEAERFAQLADPSRAVDADRARARVDVVHRAVEHLTTYQMLPPTQQANVLAQLSPPGATTTRLLAALPDHIPPAPAPPAGSRLDTLLSDAETRPAADEPPTAPAQIGHTLRQGLAALSYEWQCQVMRRLADGITPLDAISTAVRAHLLAIRHGSPQDSRRGVR